MSERPTPEEIEWEVLSGEDQTYDDVVYALRMAGMVVGYPDDPEIVGTVIRAATQDGKESFLALPEVRRAVTAALPQVPPTEFYKLSQYSVFVEPLWRWLREEAFK